MRCEAPPTERHRLTPCGHPVKCCDWRLKFRRRPLPPCWQRVQRGCPVVPRRCRTIFSRPGMLLSRADSRLSRSETALSPLETVHSRRDATLSHPETTPSPTAHILSHPPPRISRDSRGSWTERARYSPSLPIGRGMDRRPSPPSNRMSTDHSKALVVRMVRSHEQPPGRPRGSAPDCRINRAPRIRRMADRDSPGSATRRRHS